MIECFNSLEIPYSVVIFADYKFQYVIKQFEEEHSEYIIQRIFDCMMVERFRTRIADACYFINEKIQNKSKDYKAVFIISNGVEPKLSIGEQWEQLFNKEKISYGFFFVHPTEENELEEDDFLFLKNMWNKFRENTGTSVISINEDDILNDDITLIANFTSVFNKLNPTIKEENENKNQFFQPEFEAN